MPWLPANGLSHRYIQAINTVRDSPNTAFDIHLFKMPLEENLLAEHLP